VKLEDPGEGGIGGIIGGLGDVINGVSGTVSYLSDPWGNTFDALRGAAAGLSRDVLPSLTKATLPDLTTDWFINAYKVSFATAIFVAVALLIPQAVRTARGHQAGRDLVQSLGSYFAIFLVGAMFGPAFGMILVNFFRSLSDVVVSWGVQGSIDGVIDEFQAMIEDSDPVGIAGGLPVAVLLMLCILIGLFLVLVMLIVQLVTLYFTGVLLPLGLVWIIDPTKRTFGLRLVTLWVGILASHPLLFFLLGFAFTMMAGSVGTFGNNFALEGLIQRLVAIVALFVAALSPMLLLKFAPVIPTGFGGTNGPSLAPSSIGSKNMSDATQRLGQTSKSGSKKSTPSSNNQVSYASAESPAAANSLSDVAAKRAATSEAAAGGATAGAGAGPAAGMSGAASAGSATGTAAGAAGGLGAAGGAGAGASAAGGLAAAGAAETATGAGAAIGVPTLIAAAGIVAVTKGFEMGEKAGEQATDQMDNTTIGRERTP
jgi:type IV secretion system protein TrbL